MRDQFMMFYLVMRRLSRKEGLPARRGIEPEWPRDLGLGGSSDLLDELLEASE